MKAFPTFVHIMFQRLCILLGVEQNANLFDSKLVLDRVSVRSAVDRPLLKLVIP